MIVTCALSLSPLSKSYHGTTLPLKYVEDISRIQRRYVSRELPGASRVPLDESRADAPIRKAGLKLKAPFVPELKLLVGWHRVPTNFWNGLLEDSPGGGPPGF